MAHPTRQLVDPDGRAVRIDVDLADVISELWRRGVRTVQCCQEYQPGLAWIAFDDQQSALGFVEALGLRDDDPNGQEFDFSDRALQWSTASPSSMSVGDDWRWSATPRPSEGTFDIAVEFPRSDLPLIRERLGLA